MVVLLSLASYREAHNQNEYCYCPKRVVGNYIASYLPNQTEKESDKMFMLTLHWLLLNLTGSGSQSCHVVFGALLFLSSGNVRIFCSSNVSHSHRQRPGQQKTLNGVLMEQELYVIPVIGVCACVCRLVLLY